MLTGKIIFLSAILFFVLLFLCICCSDSYAMWRRIQAQARPWIIHTPPALAPAPRHQKSGDLLRSLKVLKWKSVDAGMPLQECAICLGELVEGDKVRILPECRHAFHLECIDMWLHSHPTCPLCRNTLNPDHHQMPYVV